MSLDGRCCCSCCFWTRTKWLSATLQGIHCTAFIANEGIEVHLLIRVPCQDVGWSVRTDESRINLISDHSERLIFSYSVRPSDFHAQVNSKIQKMGEVMATGGAGAEVELTTTQSVRSGARFRYGYWLQPMVNANDLAPLNAGADRLSDASAAIVPPRRGRGRPRVERPRDESAIEVLFFFLILPFTTLLELETPSPSA